MANERNVGIETTNQEQQPGRLERLDQPLRPGEAWMPKLGFRVPPEVTEEDHFRRYE